PLPGGRLTVLDGDGKTYAFVTSARQFDLSLPLGGNPVYGCIVGNFDKDITSNAPEQIEVFGITAEGAVQGFNIPIRGNGKTAWSAPYGGQDRMATASSPAKPSSIRTVTAVDTMFVWPNPVKGSSANLKYKLSKGMDKVSIKIFDAAGTIVFSKSGLPTTALWNQIPLSLNRVAPGFYSLKLEAESGGNKVVRFANFGLVR
ncbi:MAG: T9SS type A sorting domain-containing protein, partial [Fibrobacteres bacterium]|nr:T9SS type A sorting domain-containing protein [Fibrobacterota bacterium]